MPSINSLTPSGPREKEMKKSGGKRVLMRARECVCERERARKRGRGRDTDDLLTKVQSAIFADSTLKTNRL